jgi:hypothetical protein
MNLLNEVYEDKNQDMVQMSFGIPVHPKPGLTSPFPTITHLVMGRGIQ